ncbi:MAG: hypothetical protein ACRCY3_15100 [Sphingorhabdus sp.]
MSMPNNRVATAFALMLILPFATGMVQAAESPKSKSNAEKMAAPASDKPVPPPTIDSNQDGKPDAWDRDANGMADAWDVNDDGKPDLLDDNGDGKPDEGSKDGGAPKPAEPKEDQPRN